MHLKKILTSIIFLAILLIFPCSAYSQQVNSKAYHLMLRSLLAHNIPEISVSQIPQDAASLLFLDARSLQEYQVSHIRNAIWVGYKDFRFSRIPPGSGNRNIIVYCSVGYRSEKIAAQLQKAKYTHVKNLYGGIFEWVNENRPVYDSVGVTQRIHAYNHLWGIWLKKGEKVY